ncbi:Hypothetical predicted protein [Pelobates cultripes]|uniref:Uncharacterized protein n=1 Tax=Pelobates cultripes TaxID=61616 RepID=A0AAD1R8A1_PELCU|nr:Hypothetical predicted protein [Pelobates cultripes]
MGQSYTQAPDKTATQVDRRRSKTYQQSFLTDAFCQKEHIYGTTKPNAAQAFMRRGAPWKHRELTVMQQREQVEDGEGRRQRDIESTETPTFLPTQCKVCQSKLTQGTRETSLKTHAPLQVDLGLA